jgi:hypothetical protein
MTTDTTADLEQRAREVAQEIDSLYEEATNNPCTCANDENGCPYCNAWEKARADSLNSLLIAFRDAERVAEGPTNNSDARERALEAAQTIMDRSSYCIWPADAKQNIADGLIAFSPRTESVPAADLLSIVSEWRVVLENTGSITLRDNDHSNLVDIAAILALRATLPADEQAAAPRSEVFETADRLARRMGGRFVLNQPTPQPASASDREEARVAKAIADAWAECGEVPFPLYDREARQIARAILAALTPDAGQVEAWQPIETAPKDGTRMNLCWEGTETLSAHVELGKWSASKGWVNTYGNPFHGDPDYYQLLPEPPIARSPASPDAQEAGK